MERRLSLGKFRFVLPEQPANFALGDSDLKPVYNGYHAALTAHDKTLDSSTGSA